MQQMTKGLDFSVAPGTGEGEDPLPVPSEVDKKLERIKWYLWHGNVFCAVQEVEDVEDEMECVEEFSTTAAKLAKALGKFRRYISANRSSIPNYGDRYRHGETISTLFAESTVNCMVSKRFVKKQQMR